MLTGSITKFIVMYDSPFWRGDGASGQSVGVRSPIEMTIDVGPPDGTIGVFAAFAFGPYSNQLASRTPEQRRSVVIDALTTRFGAQAGEPTDFVEQNWETEEWSHGCSMAHLGVGALTQFGHALRRPCGRVHWAGTETATVAHGTMDGAARSGLRAAAEAVAAL